MSVNRFEIFREFKRLIEFGDPYFGKRIFNPFQVMISQLFIETVTLINNRESNLTNDLDRNSRINYFEKTKLHLKYLKDNIIYYPKFNNKNKNYSILFFPTEHTHLDQLEPVFQTLKKQNRDFIIVSNKLPIHRKLKPIFNSIFLPKPLLNYNNRECTKLKILCKKILEDFVQHPVVQLPKYDIYKIIERELEIIVNQYYQFDLLIEKYKPQKIFVGNDTTREGRLITMLAKRYKEIKSYCIMHGSITGEPLDTYHQVDCFFLYGEAAMKDLISNGMIASNLKISGAPYLDNFIVEGNKGINQILIEKLRLNCEKPYLLITNSGPGHSTSHEHYQKTLHCIFETASLFTDIQWIIKLHRKDSIINFEKVITKYPNHKIQIISSHEHGYPKSIFSWLQGATCLLTGVSTVAIEAMALNIPVVTMDFMNEFTNVDFIEKEATIHVRSQQELNEAITSLVKNKNLYTTKLENSKLYAQQFFHKHPIKSSEVIVNELNEPN
jgi:hypothetical protein